ncbi:MAG: hypothetical protein ACRC5A_10820 [Enterobacteriaceae bacterium]
MRNSPNSENSESNSILTDGALDEQQRQDIRGRSVFAIETTAAGVMVRTAFLGEQNELLEMPAVFPTLNYALNQIDELRRLVVECFAQAAQVGVQVIAAQNTPNNEAQQITGNDETEASKDNDNETDAEQS